MEQVNIWYKRQVNKPEILYLPKDLSFTLLFFFPCGGAVFTDGWKKSNLERKI